MAILVLRTAADTVPSQFSFTDQTGVALSSTIIGAAVTISGLGSGVSIPFTASGGSIDKNSDGNFQSSQTLGNGDAMRPSVTSSGSDSTAVNCVVTGGGVSDTFTATTLASGGSTVDLSSLPTSASFDATAYDALSVSAMAAGTNFSDPVTGVKTVKLTDSSTPNSSQHYPHYSTLGLSISQAWGAGGDKYTIALISSSGSSYLIDYQLGGTCSNYRTFPGTEGRFAFSRASGNEQIIYITSSTQLRRYNTATNSYADTGLFPYSWNTGLWLQLNHDESWATSLSSSASTVTALKLSDGSKISQGSLTSLDEIYSGYNNVAFVNRGASNSQVWNLDTNTLTAITRPNSNFGAVHMPSMNGFWMIFDSNTGGGSLKWSQIDESGANNGSHSQASGYWGQIHNSGHWQQAAGTGQYFLIAADQQIGGNPWTSGFQYTVGFLNADDLSYRLLGGHYSDSDSYSTGGTDDYYSQSHATQSTDGKIVVFGSNMHNTARIDAFLMEAPRS